MGYFLDMEDFEQAGPVAPELTGYDVGRRLGQGGNASVWLVAAQPGGGEFALKCFAPRTGSGPEDREREEGMRREVRILSALDHDHLVKAHTVVRLRGGCGEGLGLVLDYAPGGSLADLMAGRGSLDAGETVTVLTPIAQALAYLHGHGFTHGDVSPGNVLFTAHGKPLLADLGMARMVADAGGTAGAGTEGFRDPAPVDAVRGLAPERDVYSLAALGWYCLTGRAPERSAHRPPLPLLVPGVPAALVAALEAGLNEDRRQRPAAAELAAAVYHSAPAAPLDLSVSVHPSVIPQLLTRRTLPRSPRERRAGKLRGWLHGTTAPGPPPRPSQGPARSASPGRARAVRGAAASRTAVRTRIPAPRHSAGNPGAFAGRAPDRRGGLRTVVLSLALLLAAGAVVAVGLFAAGRLSPAFPPFPAFSTDGLGPGSTAGSTADGTVPGGDQTGPAQEGPADGPLAEADASPAGVTPELRALLESPDPEEAVRGLARLRALALRSGALGLLEQVNVPASSAAIADSGISSRLSASGHVLAGFSTVLTQVQASPESSPARAVVDISAASSAYREQDAAGAVVAEAAAGAEQRMKLVLVRVDGTWRIQDILALNFPAG